MKRYISELIGTYILVFCGTGVIVVNQVNEGAVGHIGICIVWGIVVMAVVYGFGSISGAHINPAVTIGFAVAKKFELKEVFPYIAFQIIGALLASFTLKFLFPDQTNLGETLPFGSEMQTFILEVLITYMLMLIILLVSQNEDVTEYTAVAVGGFVLLAAMFAGPISGASMNPARSIGPAVASFNLTSLWVYLASAVIGAILASYTWFYLKPEDPIH